MKPLISIIVPVYNVERYLSECVESIIKCSYKNIEVILVNDGSLDSSGSLCDYYANKDKRIKVIHKINGGVSDARNTGISNSTGEYLLFVDSDDFLKENSLNKLFSFIEENKDADVILYKYMKYYQHLNLIDKLTPKFNYHIINGRCGKEVLKYILNTERNDFSWFATQGIYRREFIIKNDIFFIVGRYYEDVLWLPNVLLKARKVYYLNQYVYVYRLEREGQITSTISKKTLTDNIFVVSYWYEKLKSESIDNETKSLLLGNIVTRYFYVIWFSGFLNNKERKQVILSLKENKYMMKLSNNFINKLTSIFCNIIGFNLTSLLFKNVIMIKRKLKN